MSSACIINLNCLYSEQHIPLWRILPVHLCKHRFSMDKQMLTIHKSFCVPLRLKYTLDQILSRQSDKACANNVKLQYDHLMKYCPNFVLKISLYPSKMLQVSLYKFSPFSFSSVHPIESRNRYNPRARSKSKEKIYNPQETLFSFSSNVFLSNSFTKDKTSLLYYYFKIVIVSLAKEWIATTRGDEFAPLAHFHASNFCERLRVDSQKIFIKKKKYLYLVKYRMKCTNTFAKIL